MCLSGLEDYEDDNRNIVMLLGRQEVFPTSLVGLKQIETKETGLIHTDTFQFPSL